MIWSIYISSTGPLTSPAKISPSLLWQSRCSSDDARRQGSTGCSETAPETLLSSSSRHTLQLASRLPSDQRYCSLFPRARRHGLARCFLDFLKGTGDPWCLGVITWARRAPRIDAMRESADVPWSVCYALTSTSPPNQSSGRKQSAIQWKQAFRKQHQLLLWLSIAWIAMIVDCF